MSTSTPLRIGALISPELLKELDALYPDRCPDPDDTERMVWVKVGERRVVNFLKSAFAESTENILLQGR